MTRARGRAVGYAFASAAVLTTAIGLAGTPVASAASPQHKVNVVAATAIEYGVDAQAPTPAT
jgi:hypothetical protein